MAGMKRVIPCLDVDGRGVVKGVNFEALRIVGDPLELATRYANQGADELVFLDVAATREERRPLFAVLEQVSERAFLPLTAGGGVRSVERVQQMLRAGADKVALNSAAVEDPALLSRCAERFGRQCVVLAVDVRRKPRGGWEVVTRAGTHPTGIDALEWAAAAEKWGAGELLVTSMDGDGTQAGFDTALYKGLSEVTDLPVIASGGAGSLEDFAPPLEAGAEAVLAASVFHDGRYTVGEVKRALKARGQEVRL